MFSSLEPHIPQSKAPLDINIKPYKLSIAQKSVSNPCIVVHGCNSRTRKAEVRLSKV